MEADEGYYRSAVEGAGVTLAALQVQAHIERGQVFATRLVLAGLIGLAGLLIVWGIGKLRRR
ncbi:MAG: hypothetical protein ACE5LU_03360 [Anaerolineae bacterium]